MKRLAAALSAAIVLVALLAGSAMAADTTGGNAPIDRANVDSYSGFYLVDKNNDFDATGNVSWVEFYAENTNPFELVIYRYSGSPATWSVVARRSISSIATGYNKVQVGSIAVNAGDFVGLHYTGAGSVSYDTGTSAANVLYTAAGSGASDSAAISWATGGSDNRIYSIRVSSVEPGSSSTSIVAGNSPTARSNGVDTRTNFYLVDKNNPFNANGTARWAQFYAENNNRVQVLIYRLSGTTWSVVGYSSVVTPSVGVNKISLPDISVQSGDYVGLYFPDAGSVSFDGNSTLIEPATSASVLQTRSGGGSTSFNEDGHAYVNRVYSVRVTSSEPSGTTPSTAVSAGNSVVNRGGVDTRTNFYLVDKNDPFDASGTARWAQFYAQNDKPVQVLIYRLTDSTWTVRGYSEVVTPRVGVNKVRLPDISVQSGDYVGLYFPETGSVPFDGDSTLIVSATSASVLQTRSGGGSTSFNEDDHAYVNRVYSVRITSSEPSGTIPSGGEEEDEDDVDVDDEDFGGRAGNSANFSTHLKGEGTHAQGQAIVRLSRDGSELFYKLNVANIWDVTAAHIHVVSNNDADNIERTIDLDLVDDLGGRFQGTLAEGTIVDDVDGLVEAIRDGRVYINVHFDDETVIEGWLRARGHGNGRDNNLAALDDDDDDDEDNVDESDNGKRNKEEKALAREERAQAREQSKEDKGQGNGNKNSEKSNNGRGHQVGND